MAGKIPLKLFVGQITKEWSENELIKFFQGQGNEPNQILEAQIIRDHKSQESKGCAFIKFASMTSGEKVMQQLEYKSAPGFKQQLQIKWAQGEYEKHGFPGRSDRDDHINKKLFVGSIPRGATEENLKDLFETLGEIEKLYIIRDQEKQSKGCAFITYKYKETALLAIRDLNGQVYIMDSKKPLEVRFAENKNQQVRQSHRPQRENHEEQRAPHQQQPQQQIMTEHPRVWFEYKHYVQEGERTISKSYYYYTVTQKTQYERPPAPAIILPGQENYVHQIFITENINDFTGMTKRQGPKGANLFIFHLPNDWRESDLVTQFSKFGSIISARIMTDQTGKSKGFGFVSYEKAEQAAKAIDHMNGFKCHGTKKRLKVKLKKGEDDGNQRFQHKPFMPQYQ